MKKGPLVVSGIYIYIWGTILPSYLGIMINHEIRIPIQQPGLNGKQEALAHLQVSKRVFLVKVGKVRM